jgi:DNA-binding transcriptional MerR regulator
MPAVKRIYKHEADTSTATATGRSRQEQSEVVVFGLGEAAQIVNTPPSRLKDWTIGRPFRIKASVRAASGIGSRNLFSREDLYVIALIKRLTDAGLSSRVVEGVLAIIDKTDARRSLGHILALIVVVKVVKDEEVAVELSWINDNSEGQKLSELLHDSLSVGSYFVRLKELWERVNQGIEQEQQKQKIWQKRKRE